MQRFESLGMHFAFAALLLASSLAIAAEEPAFPVTAKTIMRLYTDELIAVERYFAYAEKAKADGYANIAHLFKAVAVSESIHASNYAQWLDDNGVDLPDVTPQIRVRDTRENILEATTTEVADVDRMYPRILLDIARERNREAKTVITYAWKAERQHRQLMQKLRFAAKTWFSLLVKYIESSPTHYYVCQICGSTLTELPEKECPICHQPVSNYFEVERD